MQDVGSRIQDILERHFEVYRERLYEPTLEDLTAMERRIVEQLQAVCAHEPTLADLQTASALLGKVARTRDMVTRRFSAIETLVLDGI